MKHTILKHEKPDLDKLPGGWDLHTNLTLYGNDNYYVSSLLGPSAFVLNRVLCESDCDRLIELMKSSNIAYPVSIQGNKDTIDDRMGSVRATAWSEHLAHQIWNAIGDKIPVREMDDYSRTDWWQYGEMHRRWEPIGVSPLLRFMRYENEGQHYAHYDAGYIYPDTQYRTLMSFVLYLTTNTDSGSTRFVLDGQDDKRVWERNHNDWTRETRLDEVMFSVYPSKGSMLVFDHRLCHDVEKYTGEGPRIIIRGDVIFKASTT